MESFLYSVSSASITSQKRKAWAAVLLVISFFDMASVWILPCVLSSPCDLVYVHCHNVPKYCNCLPILAMWDGCHLPETWSVCLQMVPWSSVSQFLEVLPEAEMECEGAWPTSGALHQDHMQLLHTSGWVQGVCGAPAGVLGQLLIFQEALTAAESQ